ncbi:Nudix hydrolase 3, partial [Blomia tropicalis]
MERKHRTSVFVLEVHEELDEWEDSKCRVRRWFHVEEALRLLAVHKPVQCSYVNLLIQTSPPLRQLVPHLLTFDVARFNGSRNSKPIYPHADSPMSSLSYQCDPSNKSA